MLNSLFNLMCCIFVIWFVLYCDKHERIVVIISYIGAFHSNNRRGANKNRRYMRYSQVRGRRKLESMPRLADWSQSDGNTLWPCAHLGICFSAARSDRPAFHWERGRINNVIRMKQEDIKIVLKLIAHSIWAFSMLVSYHAWWLLMLQLQPVYQNDLLA